MKEIVVLSGKGGTGKTTLVASLAALARPLVVADCDVDAPNLSLLFDSGDERSVPFFAGHRASIRTDACSGCGECERLCKFGAIVADEDPGGSLTYRVDSRRCEGCGVCVRFCPRAAIDFPEVQCGAEIVSEIAPGYMVHARLVVGAENSGKLVRAVRDHAREQARRSGIDLVLSDGPPGIGCPAIATMSEADLALMVTEPGLSALHDLDRALDLAYQFGVHAVVCINRYDLCDEMTERIEQLCRERGIDVVAHIPFDPRVDEAQCAGRSLVEFDPRCPAALAIQQVFEAVTATASV